MYRRNQRGLATWAKWLIGIFATFLVLGLATCGIIGFATFNTVKDAMNPEKAKELASTMVTIKDPLPAPYEYKLGMNILGTVSFVTIMNDDKQYTYSLVQMQNNDSPDVTADELVEQLASQGVPSGTSGAASKIDVQDKGSMTVAGKEMPYVIGSADNKGQKVPALMGVVVPESKKVLMLIVFGPATNSSVDLEETKNFFQNIEAFK